MGPYPGVIPKVSGTALYNWTKTSLFLTPADPLKNGFIFR